jgi:hypothetical protein
MPAWQTKSCDYRILVKKDKKRFRSFRNKLYHFFRALLFGRDFINCNIRNLIQNNCKVSYIDFSRSLNLTLVLIIKQISIDSSNGYREAYNHNCERELRVNNIAHDKMHALVSRGFMDTKIWIFLSIAAYNSCLFWKLVLYYIVNFRVI